MKDYISNPLEYAQALMDEADKLYDQHSADIAKGKDHLQLKSDHLTTRGSIAGRSAHYFPELYPAMKSRAADINEVMRGGEPPIKLSPNNPDIPGIEDSVARLEEYVNDMFSAGGIWESLYQAYLTAEYSPYAPVYLGWEDKWGPLPQVDPMTGQLGYQDWIIYSGGKLTALQPEDYRGDLFARQIDDMRFHFMIKDVSDGYIMQMAKQGYYNQVQEVTAYDLLQASSGEWAKKRTTKRFNDSYLKPDDYKHEQIIGWVNVWSEEKEREVWRVCTWLGSLLLDEKESPWSALGAPFGIFNSQPLPGEIAGMSTAMVGAANQNAINEFWNMSIEADEQDIFAPIVYKGDILSQPIWENQSLWNVSEDFQHWPLVKPNTSRNMIEKIRFLEERNQQTLQSYDTMQPVTGESKQTLGEYLGKKQQHSKILGVNYQMYANQIIRLAKMSIAMARERLPDWIENGLFGQNKILQSLTIADLAADVIVEIPKVRALANEELQMIKWQNLYPQLMDNPIIRSRAEGMYETTERYLEALGEKNIDELLGPKPQTMPMLGGMNASQEAIPGQAPIPA